jgi:tRNA-Thr(GGU) m(6)t(6)A37 methyltransferase TsaA
MQDPERLVVVPVGHVRSGLKERKGAPRQPWEGAPVARIEVGADYLEALDGLKAGDDIWVLTWLDRTDRSVQKVHPRGEPTDQLWGVFATRSPDRPNPVGLHRTRVVSIDGVWIQVQELEAIDGTPVVDIKPVLERDGY